MTKKHLIQLFQERKVRTVWDDQEENYWKVLKFRLKKEGNESVTNCNQLKMVSPKDGKKYNTDVAAHSIDLMQDPELNFEQAYADYRRLGDTRIARRGLSINKGDSHDYHCDPLYLCRKSINC